MSHDVRVCLLIISAVFTFVIYLSASHLINMHKQQARRCRRRRRRIIFLYIFASHAVERAFSSSCSSCVTLHVTCWQRCLWLDEDGEYKGQKQFGEFPLKLLNQISASSSLSQSFVASTTYAAITSTYRIVFMLVMMMHIHFSAFFFYSYAHSTHLAISNR